jgi:hypothetical protein
VAENEDLARGLCFVRPPGDAEVIAAMCLWEALDADATLAPFGGDEAATVVGGKFLEAGRFGFDEELQRLEHFGKARLQVT